MALTDAQQSTIYEFINNLLDFPNEPRAFKAKEFKLMEALTNTVDLEHEFYWLGECFKRPTLYFQTLEHQGPSFTIGEVQDAILTVIASSLSKTGNAFSHWDSNTILETIEAESREIEFKSQKAVVDAGENPWQLPVLREKIYTQTFVIKEQEEVFQFSDEDFPIIISTRVAYVEITLSCSTKTKSIKLSELPRFQNEASENTYMEELLEQSATKAKSHAAQIAIDTLVEKFKLNPKNVKIARNSAGVQNLITHQYWYDLLYQRKINFNTIFDISENIAINLNQPTIISFHKKQTLSLPMAIKLTKAEMLILTHPVYYALIEKNNLQIEAFKGISERRAKLFTNPRLSHLIQREKITFEVAKTIPFHLRNILNSSLYVTFFSTNTVDWTSFKKIKEEQSPMLLDKNILRLLSNKVIGLENIVTCMEENTDLKDTLTQVLVQAFASRLYAICYQAPFRMDAHIDTVAIIQSEWPIIATEYNIEHSCFHEWILCHLFQKIGKNIVERISELFEADPRINFYQNLLQLIQQEDLSIAAKWVNLLEVAKELHYLMTSNLEISYESTLTLFSNKRKEPMSDTDILDLSRGLLLLEPMCNEEKPLHNASHFS